METTMVGKVQSLAGVALAAILLAPGVASPADGSEVITRDLGWRGGESFGVAMSARTTFTQGPVARIVVSGPREVVERIILDGDTVRVRNDRPWSWNVNRYGPVTITASGPNVRAFRAAASARIDVGTVQQPNLTLHASSSGSIRGAVRTGALNTSASSSGHVTAGGTADRVDADASSSGDVDLQGLKVQDATVRASSSGDVTVSPARSADVRASSSGRVRLLQRPASLNSQTSSSGSVRVG
jgi:hypothetical protein